MKLKNVLLLAVFSAFLLVSVAQADGLPTVDQFVLSDGSSAVMFGLNQWFLSGTQTIAAQPDGSYLLTFPMRFADGFLDFGMQITTSGNDSSIRFGCLDVLVYPEDPDPGYGESVCQSVGGTDNVQVYTDQFSDSFFSVTNGVVTFIPGVFEQFQPSTGQDAVLTITSDDPPVGAAEPSAGLLLLTGLLGFVTLRSFPRECKLWRW
jgi:hypothetical protein